MTAAQFLAGITGSPDDLRLVVRALDSCGHPWCLIGGLAVNVYAEPMVTLDADFALASADKSAAGALRAAGFVVEEFPHSLNAQLPGSALRIQITLNSRYGDFPSRALPADVFGITMPVASLSDLVQGKLWAATDPARRTTKRLKDGLDLARLAEAHPEVFNLVPAGQVPALDQIRPTHS